MEDRLASVLYIEAATKSAASCSPELVRADGQMVLSNCSAMKRQRLGVSGVFWLPSSQNYLPCSSWKELHPRGHMEYLCPSPP
jgi:hypothetical protein